MSSPDVRRTSRTDKNPPAARSHTLERRPDETDVYGRSVRRLGMRRSAVVFSWDDYAPKVSCCPLRHGGTKLEGLSSTLDRGRDAASDGIRAHAHRKTACRGMACRGGSGVQRGADAGLWDHVSFRPCRRRRTPFWGMMVPQHPVVAPPLPNPDISPCLTYGGSRVIRWSEKVAALVAKTVLLVSQRSG